MSSLAALFGGPATAKPAVEDERVLDLYWNRNELKKEFAALRTERHRLNDRIKRQQGDMARLEQKFEQLEQLLLDPATVRSVMVHYQLKSLEVRCRRKLATFAEQIKTQREKKKHNAAVAAWQADLATKVGAIEAEVQSFRERASHIDREILQVREDYAARGAFMRMLKGRRVRSQLEQLAQEAAQIELACAKRTEDIDVLRNSPPPEVRGLVLAEKRLINFMILAFAQQLCGVFGDEDLVMLVKEASDKSAGALHYGDDGVCAALLRRASEAAERLQRPPDPAQLKEHARLIAEGAAFASDDEAVPVAATVTTQYGVHDTDVVRTAGPDLLGENYWGIGGVLSR